MVVANLLRYAARDNCRIAATTFIVDRSRIFMEIHIFARYARSMNFRIRITVMQMSRNDGLNVC